MTNRPFVSKDPNLVVDGCPSAAKALITKLCTALDRHVYAGAYPPEEAAKIERDFFTTRSDLEQYIATLAKEAKK